jgi:hypothetical protein
MPRRLLSLLAALLLAACSGRTDIVGSGDGGASSSSSGGGSGSGSSSGGGCVDVSLSSFDTSCKQDQDCTVIQSGRICNGDCPCGDAAINADGQAQYSADLSRVQVGNCFCPEIGVPRCIADQCVLCSGTSNDPPACGSSVVDAGRTDAPACVNVDVSTYDTSCTQSSDCIDITAGQICTGGCACGGTTINVSGQARYEAAVAGIQTGACPCPASGMPTCIANQCVLCFWNSSTPGCPDGG